MLDPEVAVGVISPTEHAEPDPVNLEAHLEFGFGVLQASVSGKELQREPADQQTHSDRR